jgi:hypothetical protein
MEVTVDRNDSAMLVPSFCRIWAISPLQHEVRGVVAPLPEDVAAIRLKYEWRELPRSVMHHERLKQF